MKRIVSLITVIAVMATIMAAMAMPAFAFHNSPAYTGECNGNGKCTGLGVDKNKGATVNNGPPNKGLGDDRNEACENRGLCIGTRNN